MTLYRITLESVHDGPDAAPMAVLDGPTARLRSVDHHRAAREAAQVRPNASAYGPADVDDHG